MVQYGEVINDHIDLMKLLDYQDCPFLAEDYHDKGFEIEDWNGTIKITMEEILNNKNI